MFSPETIFNIGNFLILPMWLLIIFLPYGHVAEKIIRTQFAVVFLAICYSIIVLTNLSVIQQADFSSLAGIKNLFASAGKSDYFMVAAWFHYLAFDLMVGIYLRETAQKIALPQMLLGVCLFFTLMVGPLGFLMFYITQVLYIRLYKKTI